MNALSKITLAVSSLLFLSFVTTFSWGLDLTPVLSTVKSNQNTDNNQPDLIDLKRGMLGNGRKTAEGLYTLEPESVTNSRKKRSVNFVDPQKQRKSLSSMQAEQRLAGTKIKEHIEEESRVKNATIQ